MSAFYDSIRDELEAIDVGEFGADPGSGGRATRQSVMDAFVKTQSQWEGVESNMYTDVLGLVTTARIAALQTVCPPLFKTPKPI